jgi:hypothetical protein
MIINILQADSYNNKIRNAKHITTTIYKWIKKLKLREPIIDLKQCILYGKWTASSLKTS